MKVFKIYHKEGFNPIKLENIFIQKEVAEKIIIAITDNPEEYEVREVNPEA